MKRICALVVFGFLALGCAKNNTQVVKALEKVAISGSETTLGEISKFKWDKVYYIGPYQTFDYSLIKKLPDKVKKRIYTQEILNDEAMLVFTLNDVFVTYSKVHYSTTDKLGFRIGSNYSPSTVIPIVP